MYICVIKTNKAMIRNEVFAQLEVSLKNLIESYTRFESLYEEEISVKIYVVCLGQSVLTDSYLMKKGIIEFGPLNPYMIIGDAQAKIILDRVSNILGLSVKLEEFKVWYEKRGRGLYRNNIEIAQNTLNAFDMGDFNNTDELL